MPRFRDSRGEGVEQRAGDAMSRRQRRDRVGARELAHRRHVEEDVAEGVAVGGTSWRFRVVLGEA